MAAVLTMEKDPSVGWNGDKSVYLDPYRREFHEARVATKEDIAYMPCGDTVFQIVGRVKEWVRMAFEAFTDEWAKEWAKHLNRNENYRKLAATWEWPLVLRVEKDESVGLEEDRAIYLDLWHGQCREARAATEEDLENAPYIISADPYTWKMILERKLEPISTLMRGRLKLVKGDLSTLSGYVMAAKSLLEDALKVDTEIPEALK
jgi:putative sterol carrier protein